MTVTQNAPQWEYKTLVFDKEKAAKDVAPQIDIELNALGKTGWELVDVSCRYNKPVVMCFFKRALDFRTIEQHETSFPRFPTGLNERL
ncbi:MAG: hypothetical protein WCJ64_20025 [Rhodospirillaceae bacterium]